MGSTSIHRTYYIYNKYNSGYGEDIFFPYEDYCMSVDLTVHITNRYSCGWASKNNRKRTLNFSSSNNTISFLGGSKISNFLNSRYLTTNFTDINMTNPGENTSECLGIESISITYNSWMHPEVTIKFIDIRGATVMQPSEASYYNENDFGVSRELYKSLFTFPYPMFELKVKGFYGKGVTYKLAVSKSDIELDSESGNFVIVVSFIGFMYGIYADLPMTFIACAPYIPGGKEYWETKVNDGTFMFKDSSGQPSKPMCKIPELRTNIAKAASNEEFKNITANEKENGIVIQNQIDALRTLIDLYPLKNFETIGNLPYFYYVGNYEDSYSINGKIENFYKELKNYKDSYKVDYLKYFDSFKILKESEKNNVTLCESL